MSFSMESEIATLQRLAVTLENTKQEYFSKKSSLDAAATGSHNARVNAEQDSLFFEDLLSRTSHLDLTPYYPVKPMFTSFSSARTRLLSLINKHRAITTNLHMPLADYRIHLQNLANEIETQHEKLVSRERSIRSLKSQLHNHDHNEQDQSSLLQELKAATNEFDSLHRHNKTLKRHFQEVSNTLKTSNAQLESLLESNNTLSNEIDRLSSELSGLQAIKSSHEQRLECITRDSSILESLRNRLKETLQTENDLLSQHKELQETLKAKRESAAAILNNLDQAT